MDLILYGKRFSILETQVVVGGKYLTRNPQNTEQSKMDLISREVMRVLLPSGLQPTLIKDGKKYVEIVVSTPNGVSNRFPIPYGPPTSPETTPEPLNVAPDYSLMDDLLKLGANVTPDNAQHAASSQSGQSATTIQTTQTIQVTQAGQPGQGSGQGNQPSGSSGQAGQGGNPPKLTATPTSVAKGTRIRIMSKNPPPSPTATIKADFRFPVASSPETVISVVVEGITYKDNAYVIDESLLNTAFVPDLITKLDDYGKLTGQNPLHDLTTKAILITADGSDPTPKGTTNQLRVNIELYVQKTTKTPSQTTGGPATLSATATDGAGHSATATITDVTPSGTSSPSTPNTTSPSGTNAPTRTDGTNPPQDGGTNGGGSAATSGASSLIEVGSTLPPPREFPVSIRHDPVVIRAAQPPANTRSAPARPLSGINARSMTSSPSPNGVSPGRAAGTPSPTPPRGRGQPMPLRSNSTRTPARSSTIAPRKQPPLSSEDRPARRSLISRIMGKD